MVHEIQIRDMSIHRFKGIDEMEIHFAPGQTDIYGDNATGKSTVVDAFLWLTFGRDSRNATAFGIKPVDSLGRVAQHGTSSIVSATLIVDGRDVELKREYKEVWKKKRGSAQPVFSGHETVFSIDGIPKTKGEYQAFIDSMIDEKTFRMLTSPEYFADVLPWKERRAVLTELSGQISVADVVGADPSLAGIQDEVERYGLDDYLRKLKCDRTRVNRERTELPVRIDEAQRAIAGAADINVEAERLALDKTNAQIREIDAQIAELRNGGVAGELNKLTGQINSLKEQAISATHAAVGAYRTELGKWDAERRSLESERESCIARVNAADAEAQRAQQEIADMRAEYARVRDERWSVDTVCPTCGQDLPEERVEALRADYNVRQSERLEAISARGNALKRQIEAARAKAADARDRLVSVQEQLVSLLEHEPAQPERCTTYDAQIAELEAERDKLENASDDDRDARRRELESRAKGLEEFAQNYRANIAAAEDAHRTRERIEQLSRDERKLSLELEKLDQQIDACERYTQAQVGLVEDRINSQFKLARFKLFDEQVNGGIAECCELTVDGVPWGDLNSAMRINAGLDVINTLSRHYGVTAPVFVDNAESVVHLEPLDSQLIRLVVSEPDKALRVQAVA